MDIKVFTWRSRGAERSGGRARRCAYTIGRASSTVLCSDQLNSTVVIRVGGSLDRLSDVAASHMLCRPKRSMCSHSSKIHTNETPLTNRTRLLCRAKPSVVACTLALHQEIACAHTTARVGEQTTHTMQNAAGQAHTIL